MADCPPSPPWEFPTKASPAPKCKPARPSMVATSCPRRRQIRFRVAVRVIRTDEERMIAETVCCLLRLRLKKEN